MTLLKIRRSFILEQGTLSVDWKLGRAQFADKKLPLDIMMDWDEQTTKSLVQWTKREQVMRHWSRERHCSAWLSWCLIGTKVGKAEMANLQGFFQVVFFFPHSNTLVKSEKRDQQITCVCLLLSICAQKHSNPSWCTIYQEFNASKFVVFTSLLLFSILFTLQLDRVLCYHEHNHQYVFHHHQHHY